MVALLVASCALVGCSTAEDNPIDDPVAAQCIPADSPPVSMSIKGKDVVVSTADVVGSSILPPEENIDTMVGWYDGSAMPGGCNDGSIVITSHINNHGIDGVGMDFANLAEGEKLSLTTADGKNHEYVVVDDMELVNKDSPNFNEKGKSTFNKSEGEEILVLVTCAGEFDPQSPLGYQSNGIIVLEPNGGENAT